MLYIVSFVLVVSTSYSELKYECFWYPCRICRTKVYFLRTLYEYCVHLGNRTRHLVNEEARPMYTSELTRSFQYEKLPKIVLLCLIWVSETAVYQKSKSLISVIDKYYRPHIKNNKTNKYFI